MNDSVDALAYLSNCVCVCVCVGLLSVYLLLCFVTPLLLHVLAVSSSEVA